MHGEIAHEPCKPSLVPECVCKAEICKVWRKRPADPADKIDAAEWKLDQLAEICTEIGFDELNDSLAQVLSGGANGRFVLDLNR